MSVPSDDKDVEINKLEEEPENIVKEEEEEDKCPVCLSSRTDESGIDGCTHTFCYSCITEWLKVSESCPLCKAPVTEVRTSRLVNGEPVIKKLTELKAEAEAARIMAQANEVPMTSEREAVSQLIHQQRATVQKLIADKTRNKKNKLVNEQYKRETSELTQLTALKDEMDRLPRRDIMGDIRFRRVVYTQQLLWKPITRPSTAIRFNSAVACADPDKLMKRLKPFLMRELKIVMDPKKKPSDRVLQNILTAIQNHEINNPNFELVLLNMRLFLPWFIGIFSHLLYEFCASGLELEAFDANSMYSLDPARAPSGRLIPNLLPATSQNSDDPIFINEDDEVQDDDDSVIIDRAHRSDSSSSDGVTGLYNHRACRVPPSQYRNPFLSLSSNRSSAFRDVPAWNNLLPPYSLHNFGNVPFNGRTLSDLFPSHSSHSTSTRTRDPEVISLEDETAAGDEARINSIHRRDMDSSVPSWLRNITGDDGPSTSSAFGSQLNPQSVNGVERRAKDESSWRRGGRKEERGIETSWRAEKEKKEESRREKKRHEENILGVRVTSRKNSLEYYYNKIIKGGLSVEQLQRMNGELTTFANRINYLKEECNRKMAENGKTKEDSANGSSRDAGEVMAVDDDIIHVEDQSAPSITQDDSIILCDS